MTINCSKDQNQGLDCRIISVIDRFNQKGAKARIGKYRFCDNRTSQQKAELQTHNRHDGDHGVAENMLQITTFSLIPFALAVLT